MIFSSTGDSVKNFVYRIAGAKYKDLVTLIFGWESIVGKILSGKSKVVRIEKNTLFVAVVNNVWMQELVLRKDDIKKNIKAKLHVDLEEIVFFLNMNY